jgi:hypothetical protein
MLPSPASIPPPPHPTTALNKIAKYTILCMFNLDYPPGFLNRIQRVARQYGSFDVRRLNIARVKSEQWVNNAEWVRSV